MENSLFRPKIYTIYTVQLVCSQPCEILYLFIFLQQQTFYTIEHISLSMKVYGNDIFTVDHRTKDT